VLFTILSILFHALLQAGLFTTDPSMVRFLNTLKFHYMGVGSLFACLLFYRGGQLRQSFLMSYGFQILTVAVLVYHYVIGIPAGRFPIVLDLALAFFYGVLILQVSVAPRHLLNLEWQPLTYLGQISYGIYMFHMTVDYLLRTVFLKIGLGNRPSQVLPFIYGTLLLAATIFVAHISYHWLESRFLRFAHRHRRMTPAQVAGSVA
jgi:peptidoglycan/LPS O-acetylase OafA/YrhL